MAGNAHRNRSKRFPVAKHDSTTCLKCVARPKRQKLAWGRNQYRNSNGHRSNPAT